MGNVMSVEMHMEGGGMQPKKNEIIISIFKYSVRIFKTVIG